MKKILFLLLPLILAACNPVNPSSSITSEEPSSESPSSEVSSEEISFEESSEEISSEEEYVGSTLPYYENIDFSLTGVGILYQLQDLMFETHTYYTSYGGIRSHFKNSDKDPDNSGKILTFYDGKSVNGSWDSGKTYNREHVWAQANSEKLFGESGCGADLHHIRPADPSLNSSRGDDKFGYVDGGTSLSGGCERKNGVFEPSDEYKGDTARIIMYCYVHYSSEIQGYDHEYVGNLKLSNQISKDYKNLLIEWNELDPVSEVEKNRNEYVYDLQGNRNPFIDCPDLMERCF